jgi:hypothetical protein
MEKMIHSMDKPAVRRTWKIKSRLRLSLFITFILILIISLASSLMLKGKAMEAPDRYLSWNVIEGDTLWSIARCSLPQGRDIRDYIYEIKEINQLQTSNIRTGQQLQIPIYSKDGRTDGLEFSFHKQSQP